MQNGTPASSPASPPPYAEPRWSVWARSVGGLLVGVTGVLLSCVSLTVSQSVRDVQRSMAATQTKNSADDIALKHQTYEHQRRVDAAQLAASLVGHLKCDDDVERAAALTLLSSSAPEHADKFSNVLLQKCARLPAGAIDEVSQLKQQAAARTQITEFSIRLANAREYKSKGHPGPAARLFQQASAMIPKIYELKVNKGDLERAKRAYDRGDFPEAADSYALAFAAIEDPL